EGGDLVPGLTSDLREVSPRVDRLPRDGEGSDGTARVRVPGCRGAGRGGEGGNVVAALAADLGEEAARIDRGAGDGEGENVVVCARVPGGGLPGRGVEGGDGLRAWPAIWVKLPPA